MLSVIILYIFRTCFIIYYMFYVTFWQFIDILANQALTNLKVLKKSQSILITGTSGSGKTETAKHIIEFLSRATNLQDVFKSSPIFEAFGHAKTRGNANSSRFCKYIEVIYFFFLYMYFRSNLSSSTNNVFYKNLYFVHTSYIKYQVHFRSNLICAHLYFESGPIKMLKSIMTLFH